MKVSLREHRCRAARFAHAVSTLSVALLVAAAAQAQLQTKDQRKCTAALDGVFAQIAAAAGKHAVACIKRGAKGTLAGSIDACVDGDPDRKLTKLFFAGEKKFDKLCTGASSKPPMLPKLPPYGVTEVPTASAAAADASRAIVRDVFGDALEAAIVRESADKDAAKCQQGIANRAAKCAAAHVRGFNACRAAGLERATAPFDDAGDLVSCLGDDPKGTIAKQCDLSGGKVDGIRKTLDKKCRAKDVSLSAALPGCASDDVEAAHACVNAAARCRVCLGLNRAGDLAGDCDAFDDGAANESCVAPFVVGRHECTLSEETAAFTLETAAFYDLSTLTGSLEVDCGAVDPATGRAACTCSLLHLDPVPIVPGLGVACVNPAAGCPAGEISCSGGALYNSAITAEHNIGSCTGNGDCAQQCAIRCATASSVPFDTACEGFCRGGAGAGAACTADAGCAGGTCNGLDGAPHGNACQCSCVDVAGDLSPPGGMHCNLGIDVVVEMAAPCGDGDVLFRVGERCVPLTTEIAQAVIVGANNDADQQIPEGLEINGGLPLTCPDLAANGTSGLFLVSAVNALDIELAGDIAFTFLLGCE